MKQLDSVTPSMEALKAAPSVGAIFIAWASVPVEAWAARVGLVLLLIQAAELLWRWRRNIRREAERKRDGSAAPDTDQATE